MCPFLTAEGDAEDEETGSLENAVRDFLPESKSAELDNDTTEDDVNATTGVKLDVTAAESNVSDPINDYNWSFAIVTDLV